ncbi:MAG: hypothetical protein JW795_06280 [Chitinivibrionales bacterium]|nr:hypothetical protein [Chitinivibrionales bacterium]
MQNSAHNNQESKTFKPIEHHAIRLPKGGGAIRGIGEKFQANPATGSGSFSIPLPISPGREGVQPDLSLGYSSGSGSSEFGLGWSVKTPSITRKTDKELPRYIDDTGDDTVPVKESDTYLLAGAEDLVPVLEKSGNGWKRVVHKVTEKEATTDIVYLGSGRPKIYFNQAGKGWSSPVELTSFPPVDSLSSVSMIDLLGTGTMCLVWSTQLPGKAGQQMRYVDLMGVKPHLLSEINDNMGSRIRLSYAPSTKFYLEDKKKGAPWVTRFMFPVHCLERVETVDEISGSKLVTQYGYHHGYFDCVESEFRGFGMVETIDTESFEEWNSRQAPAPASTYDLKRDDEDLRVSYVAPVLTKTWYHTGAFVEAGTISKQCDGEYFKGDREAFVLPDTVIDDSVVMDRELPLAEAYRALKGSALRQETYELGVATPYEVKEANFIVRCVQEKGGNKNAVFFTHPHEAITFHYEKIPHDPPIGHEFTLEVDDFGNVRKKMSVVYLRRPVAGALPQQQKSYATLTAMEYINENDDFYRVGLPYEESLYELKGNIPFDGSGMLSMANATAFVKTALRNTQTDSAFA